MTTIGDIKCLSKYIVNFVMCFLSSSFLSSKLTLSCNLSDLRLFFGVVVKNVGKISILLLVFFILMFKISDLGFLELSFL